VSRRLVPLAAALALVCVASAARAGMLDPFAPARRLSLDPFRKVADKLADATKVADNAPAAPAPAAAPAAHSCQRDEDCTGENICESNVCQPIQLRTNVLYLYYREGAFTEFLGLYW